MSGTVIFLLPIVFRAFKLNVIQKNSIPFVSYINNLNTLKNNKSIANESFFFFSIWQIFGKQTALFSSDSERKQKNVKQKSLQTIVTSYRS